MNAGRAVVLVSGGLDSATVLAIAHGQGYACHAVSFDYGQRHRAELEAARRVAAAGGAVEHRVMAIDWGGIGGERLKWAVASLRRPMGGDPFTVSQCRRGVADPPHATERAEDGAAEHRV